MRYSDVFSQVGIASWEDHFNLSFRENERVPTMKYLDVFWKINHEKKPSLGQMFSSVF